MPGTNPRISRVVSKSDRDHRKATTAHRTLSYTSGVCVQYNVICKGWMQLEGISGE